MLILRFYRSTDATITRYDSLAGIFVQTRNARSPLNIALTAPSTPGTYYYGACVDAVSGESNTTNNCSDGVAVTVGEPPAPDLVVRQVSVSDNNPTAGESFTLSATVRNQGSGPSDLTTLRYYRSTDSTITKSDTGVGTSRVPAVPAPGSKTEIISLTAPSTAGTYYYGACVDAVVGESDTTNNCSAAVTVTVGATPTPIPTATLKPAGAPLLPVR